MCSIIFRPQILLRMHLQNKGVDEMGNSNTTNGLAVNKHEVMNCGWKSWCASKLRCYTYLDSLSWVLRIAPYVTVTVAPNPTSKKLFPHAKNRTISTHYVPWISARHTSKIHCLKFIVFCTKEASIGTWNESMKHREFWCTLARTKLEQPNAGHQNNQPTP